MTVVEMMVHKLETSGWSDYTARRQSVKLSKPKQSPVINKSLYQERHKVQDGIGLGNG